MTEEKEKIDDPTAILRTLRADANFLRHYLANYIVSVQVKDNLGNIVNSFAAAQIPDWAIRQRLDDIDEAIAYMQHTLAHKHLPGSS